MAEARTIPTSTTSTSRCAGLGDRTGDFQHLTRTTGAARMGAPNRRRDGRCMGAATEVSGASSAEVRCHADLPTLAALGIVAFVAQSLLHEAVGHGAACLAIGGRITWLTPMYMRCSVESPAMVAAGPALN